MKQNNATRENKEMIVLGIDLAKHSFQLHGVDEDGHVVLKKKLSRRKLTAFIVNLPPCLIGLEACGGAHHWIRVFTAMGHTVRMMAPQFVKPYVKSNKNHAVDAEAICEAVQRPNMRFVPVKCIEQQDIQSVHRILRGRNAQIPSGPEVKNEPQPKAGYMGAIFFMSRTNFSCNTGWII